MTGLTEQINAGGYARLRSNDRYAPFRNARENAGSTTEHTSRMGGVAAIAALLVLSGVTIAFARGYASMVENFGISQETALGLAWVLQGGLALSCFFLVVRWLRS
jgi:hypothetical protein